jgi:hypothetical protein
MSPRCVTLKVPMPEVCTCGAQLAPDSLFCHKCGKAQREIVEPEILPPPRAENVPPAEVAPAVSLPPLNFRNPLAVRIALLVAVVATLLTLQTRRIAPFPFLNWVAAGFFAVLFYKRKTGSLLNVGAGARMGWLTGILMSGLWSVLFVFELLFGNLRATIEEQFRHLPQSDPVAQQMLTFIQSGPGFAAVLLFSLVMLFCFITGLSVAGGAIGAKMIGRDSS